MSVPMDDRAIAEYVSFACHLADLAGATILPYFRKRIDIENKKIAGEAESGDARR